MAEETKEKKLDEKKPPVDEKKPSQTGNTESLGDKISKLDEDKLAILSSKITGYFSNKALPRQVAWKLLGDEIERLIK